VSPSSAATKFRAGGPDAAKRAMAAPAKTSVPALAMRRIEVKRFRLNAGAVFIFIRVEFSVSEFETRRLRDRNYPTQVFFLIFLKLVKNASYARGDLHMRIKVLHSFSAQNMTKLQWKSLQRIRRRITSFAWRSV